MFKYTKSELQKKYTVQDAINSASLRLGNIPMCMNIVSNIPKERMINLEELNELADRLVDDSYYWR